MPRWEPLHPAFVEAVLALDAEGMPSAELWRLLARVAARIGEPRPSYWRVRRLAIVVRRVKRAHSEELDRILRRTLAGLAPIPTVG